MKFSTNSGLSLAGAVCGLGLLSACATEPPAAASMGSSGTGAPPPRVAAANPVDAEFAWSLRPGGNALNGVVAYRPQKTQRWTCAMQSVALMPDSATSRARIMALYGSVDFAVKTVAEVRQKSAAVGEAAFSAYVKQTACDASEHFAFENLTDGGYFLVARAKRIAPKADDEGVVIVQRVTLSGGKGATVRLPAF